MIKILAVAIFLVSKETYAENYIVNREWNSKEYLMPVYVANPVRKSVPLKFNQFTSGNIIFGAGYSSDLQQVTPQKCFNATISSISEQKGYIQLDSAISFLELESKLGISISINGKYLMFAADAKANYMRSLQDTDYAISLNYYEYATNNVAVQIGGFSEEALTESAKAFYNNSNNPLFGLVCGDYYIASYEQGALLTMSLIIKLSSSKAKKEFREKAGVTFGNIVSAAESLKTVSANSKITGSITIQAFQIGGEPSQLSKILNKDSSGNYYALTCNLQAMDNCIKTVSGLLDYAKDNFATQFSFKNNTGLTPLGIDFSNHEPIERIGLIPPVSLVTQEVVQYRNDLSRKLKENEYYQQKLYPFFNNGYPVKLDDAFIDNANLILSKADSNVRRLMQPHEGAADCFNFPERCRSIKANIDSELQNITIRDLKFLDDIKYIIPTPYATLYNTGGGSTVYCESWVSVPNIWVTSVKVESAHIVDKQCSYCIDVKESPYAPFLMCYNGNLTSDLEYVGTICSRLKSQMYWDICSDDQKQKRKISPFFFEAYNDMLKGATIPSNVY